MRAASVSLVEYACLTDPDFAADRNSCSASSNEAVDPPALALGSHTVLWAAAWKGASSGATADGVEMPRSSTTRQVPSLCIFQTEKNIPCWLGFLSGLVSSRRVGPVFHPRSPELATPPKIGAQLSTKGERVAGAGSLLRVSLTLYGCGPKPIPSSAK